MYLEKGDSEDFIHAFEILQECLQIKEISAEIQIVLQDIVINNLDKIPSPVVVSQDIIQLSFYFILIYIYILIFISLYLY